MHCYKIIIIIIIIIILQKLKFVTYPIIFVWLTFAFLKKINGIIEYF